MESTERLVRTWMGSRRDIEIQETVSGVTNGEITLLNIVKALGEYLTAEEDDLRTKGVEFLSLVLESCPPEKILRQSEYHKARVLITFYCNKLDDTETIIPALKGLSTLASLLTCTSNDAEEIVRALFFHVKMNALTAPNRFVVFSIIDSLMARQRDALKGMGKEFISGYIALAEGEKDPRNLLTAFAIVRVILIEFNIVDHVEALFNITFCYFPISFRPPPNDPYGIGADDLKTALRLCLCATPLFGPLAIPVYLEKLIAGSPTSKRDTLQSMSASFPVYGASLARASARKLWSSLKLEIFQPTDSITEEEALRTTQILIRTIYADRTELYNKDTDGIQGLAQEACEECIKILQEPEKSQAKPAIKVLCAFMATTPSVSRYTISQAVPHLVKLFLKPDELPNRPPISVLLAELVAAARDSISNSEPSLESDVPLMPFKDEVLGVFTVGLKTAPSCQPALAGLKAMVTTPGLLTDEELGFIVHSANDILQADPGDDDASDDVLDLFSSVSSISSRHVEEQTLPLLFSSLPDTAPARTSIIERSRYWRVLTALSKLCIQPELFETLVIRLSTKLDFICVATNSRVIENDPEPAAAYAHSILTALANTLQTKVDLKHTDIPKYIDRLVSRLYNLFIHGALLSADDNIATTDLRVISVAARIVTLVVQALSVQRQETFVKALFSAYLTGDIKTLAEGCQKLPTDVCFQPLELASPTSQRNLIVLFAAGSVPLHKDVRIPVENLDQFLSNIIELNFSAQNDLQKDSGCHMLAAIINKRIADVSPFLVEMRGKFWSQEIANISSSSKRRSHAIAIWVWISKALLVQNHPDSIWFVDSLFNVLNDEHIGWDAARAIGEIGAADNILTKRNHAIVKILYAQKYSSSMLPRIMQGANSASQAHEQSAYLVALAYLIKSMPQATYVHEMPSLMPLLLRGLDLPDAEIRANVIDTLVSAVGAESTEHSALSEHASTLVSAMLKNCMASEISSTRVRMAALRYLGILPSIVRYDVLHPYKATVIRELSKVLDDPKRSVRKEAVDARTNWFKYNG